MPSSLLEPNTAFRAQAATFDFQPSSSTSGTTLPKAKHSNKTSYVAQFEEFDADDFDLDEDVLKQYEVEVPTNGSLQSTEFSAADLQMIQ